MKTTYLLALFVSACIILSFANVQAQTQFSGNVLIKTDGSIEPSVAPIQRSGEIYTLLSDFVGNITIQRDNIVLEGNGFAVSSTVTGTETTVGVDLSFRINVTITNLQISGFVQGIHLLNSTNCSLIGNNIKDDIDGIRIDNSTGNFIIGNNITANRHGTHPYQGNLFYHNNFVNSSDMDALFGSPNYVDTWDNGYPSGGNYWSNYTGVDEKKGSGQDESGSDGIGDTPQVLSTNNIDRYPLMVPYAFTAQPPSQQDLLWAYVVIGIVVAIAVVIAAFLFFRRRVNSK